jgi:hypothetical protein
VKATLEAINQMQADGIIGEYAIGGAVGATFYLAPAATVDLDILPSRRQQATDCSSACRRFTNACCRAAA